MNKIICSVSAASVGCTFLDWTINFLSGAETFLSYERGRIPLSKNPLTAINAHGHAKNHPGGYQDFKQYLHRLKQLANGAQDLITIYPGKISESQALQSLSIGLDDIDQENLNRVNQYLSKDFEQLLNHLDEINARVVYLSLSESIPLYFVTPRILKNTFRSSGQHLESTIDLLDDRSRIFCRDSMDTWQQLELTDTWDKRERLALDFRPFDPPYQYIAEPMTISNLNVDAIDFWHRGDVIVHNIMDWLEIKVDQQRLEQWLPIFKPWQQIQLNLLQFQHSYKNILAAIIAGDSMHIDLTFEQEVVIQHCLIYQHNLNLKTWQLEKFPNDTMDLHKLLEPNMHPVHDIYNLGSTS